MIIPHKILQVTTTNIQTAEQILLHRNACIFHTVVYTVLIQIPDHEHLKEDCMPCNLVAFEGRW
jgi:hypothetical protein